MTSLHLSVPPHDRETVPRTRPLRLIFVSFCLKSSSQFPTFCAGIKLLYSINTTLLHPLLLFFYSERSVFSLCGIVDYVPNLTCLKKKKKVKAISFWSQWTVLEQNKVQYGTKCVCHSELSCKMFRDGMIKKKKRNTERALQDRLMERERHSQWVNEILREH